MLAQSYDETTFGTLYLEKRRLVMSAPEFDYDELVGQVQQDLMSLFSGCHETKKTDLEDRFIDGSFENNSPRKLSVEEENNGSQILVVIPFNPFHGSTIKNFSTVPIELNPDKLQLLLLDFDKTLTSYHTGGRDAIENLSDRNKIPIKDPGLLKSLIDGAYRKQIPIFVISNADRFKHQKTGCFSGCDMIKRCLSLVDETWWTKGVQILSFMNDSCISKIEHFHPMLKGKNLHILTALQILDMHNLDPTKIYYLDDDTHNLHSAQHMWPNMSVVHMTEPLCRENYIQFLSPILVSHPCL